MWLEIVLGIAIVAILGFALYIYLDKKARVESQPVATTQVQSTIDIITDFRCLAAPGGISSPIILSQKSPGTLTVVWGAATIETRGVYYDVTATGPGGPYNSVVSGLSTTFYNLPAGSTWSVTVQPKSKCGDGPLSAAATLTLCSGPPAVVPDLVGLPPSGNAWWAPSPGATNYGIIFYDQATGNIVRAATNVTSGYPFSFSGPVNAKIIASNACGWSGTV